MIKNLPKGKSIQRIVIYPKDIMLLMGKSLPTARHIARQIRKKLDLPTRYITIQDFCQYFRNFSEATVREVLSAFLPLPLVSLFFKP